MKINHGANLFELSKSLGIKKDSFIDFSSNINPFGLSPKSVEALKENIHLASIYPDPEYVDLKNSISEYCHCNSDNLVLGSGATELISSSIKVVSPKKALLLSPAYSEYEKELLKINCEVIKIFYKKENNFKININEIKDTINKNEIDMIIICNPNNPTGTLLTLDEIKNISNFFKKTIMIDETYIEFTDFSKTSAINLINSIENIIVIRGTSKFFSTPGIRLGYAIISKGEILDGLKSLPNLWNINIFADVMGEAMFKDIDFINFCRKNFEINFNFLFSQLKTFTDFKVYNSNSNFILCEILNDKFNSDDLHDFLLEKGIIIRNAKSFEGLDNKFFRVCVLNKENIEKLIFEIKNFIQAL